MGLDGLPIVLVTQFRDPAPTKIISASASKDGKMLAKTVRSTYKFLKLEIENTSRSSHITLCNANLAQLNCRFESDKGCENSGNNFDTGLGETGLYNTLFHPIGADWGDCQAHDKHNQAKRFEEGTST